MNIEIALPTFADEEQRLPTALGPVGDQTAGSTRPNGNDRDRI
jgi:hypothetical protein